MDDIKKDDKICDLHELSKDLLDALYNNNIENYEITKISLSNLDLKRFKFESYDLKSIFNVEKLEFTRKFISGIENSDKNVTVLDFLRLDQNIKTGIQIIAYANKNNMNDISNPININQILKTLFSKIVLENDFRQSLLPIINVDVKGSDLQEFEIVKPYINKDKYYSIQITERFYKFSTLEEFLNEYPMNNIILINILFDCLRIIIMIEKYYKNFRYNQFFPQSLYCYYRPYKVNDSYIPEIKLGDYYLSTLDNIFNNPFASDIPFIDSSYSDLYQLLNYLFNKYNKIIIQDEKMREIYDIFLPEKIRSKNKYLQIELWDSLTENEQNNLIPTNLNKILEKISNEKKYNQKRINGIQVHPNYKKYHANIAMKKNRAKYNSISEFDSLTETTENHHPQKPAKIISVNSEEIEPQPSRIKSKTYHGKRTLYKPQNNPTDLINAFNLNDPQLNHQQYNAPQNYFPQERQQNYMPMTQENMQSRFNPFASVLGNHNSDLNRSQQQFQSMNTQPFDNQMMQQQVPQQVPQQMMQQPNMQVNTNPAIQTFNQQPMQNTQQFDENAYARYVSAMNMAGGNPQSRDAFFFR